MGGNWKGGNSNPAEAMWDAMEQIKSTFDKRVGTRMGRGDVRNAVLALLIEGPMHGYQIIREIEERTGGRWKPSAGSVYPTLQLLADEGLIVPAMENDRKVYTLTEHGRPVAEAAAADAPWDIPSLKDSLHMGAVPKAGMDLAQAVSQVARSGSEAQQAQAAEVLDEARRKIYSILAQA